MAIEKSKKLITLKNNSTFGDRVMIKLSENCVAFNGNPDLVTSPAYSTLTTTQRWRRLLMEKQIMRGDAQRQRWVDAVLGHAALQTAVDAVVPNPELNLAEQYEEAVTDAMIEARMKVVWQQMAEADFQ